MAANRRYTIAIAAVNAEGVGPFSTPLDMELDPVLFHPYPLPGYHDPVPQWTLIIVIGCILGLVLLCLAVMLLYRKRIFDRTAKPQGYLEAASTDDFHPCQMTRKIDENLWIDRRWNTGDYSGSRGEVEEKESNSSEKKLLNPHHPNSNSNSDTEYTYVDGVHRQTLNASSFTASSGSSKSRRSNNSPEPYATTDIFRSNGQLNHFQGGGGSGCNNIYYSRHHDQEMQSVATPIMNYKRSANSHKSCDYIPNKSIARGSAAGALSCDDLTRSPHHKSRQDRLQQKQRSAKLRGQANPNLMDILPPPPSCPPPNTNSSIYAESQESVISPKYLFQHPVYQSANRHMEQASSNYYSQGANLRRVFPSPNTRYQEITQQEPVSEVFTRLLPDPTASHPGIPVAVHSQKQHKKRPSIEDLEEDLANELQTFNEAITNFSSSRPVTTPQLSHRRRFQERDIRECNELVEQEDIALEDRASSCDADQEDNLSVGTQ